jgi:hypothetical protein
MEWATEFPALKGARRADSPATRSRTRWAAGLTAAVMALSVTFASAAQAVNRYSILANSPYRGRAAWD